MSETHVKLDLTLDLPVTAIGHSRSALRSCLQARLCGVPRIITATYNTSARIRKRLHRLEYEGVGIARAASKESNAELH